MVAAWLDFRSNFWLRPFSTMTANSEEGESRKILVLFTLYDGSKGARWNLLSTPGKKLNGLVGWVMNL